MESEKEQRPSRIATRATRGVRNVRQIPEAKAKPEEKSKSPPENLPSQRKAENEEELPEKKEANTTVSRNPPSRGRGRPTQRRNPRQRQVPNRRNRLERAQNVDRNFPNKQNGRFRSGPNRFNSRRRRFGLREIFIAGLPRNVDNKRLFNLLKNEGRITRCNVLKTRNGFSRGIAFAEFQNPRDAWKVINKWRGRKVGRFTIFVAFKRNNRQPQRRYNYGNRFRRYRNNYGGRFESNQGQFGNRGGFVMRYRGSVRGGFRRFRGN